MSHGHSQSRSRKVAVEAPKASGDALKPQPRKHSSRNRSKAEIPKSVRYDLENALVGLCDVWFEDIKPHLVRNKIKLHVEGLAECSGDGRLPVAEPGCPHLDPGAASDRRRRQTANYADCCSTLPTASRAPCRRPRTLRPPPHNPRHPSTPIPQILNYPSDNRKFHNTEQNINPPPPSPSTDRCEKRSSNVHINKSSSKTNQSDINTNIPNKNASTSSSMPSWKEHPASILKPKKINLRSPTSTKSQLSPSVNDDGVFANHVLPLPPNSRRGTKVPKKLPARAKALPCPATFYSIMKRLNQVEKNENPLSSANPKRTEKRGTFDSLKTNSTSTQTYLRQSSSKKPVVSKCKKIPRQLVETPRWCRRRHSPSPRQISSNKITYDELIGALLGEKRSSKVKVLYDYTQRTFENRLIIARSQLTNPVNKQARITDKTNTLKPITNDANKAARTISNINKAASITNHANNAKPITNLANDAKLITKYANKAALITSNANKVKLITDEEPISDASDATLITDAPPNISVTTSKKNKHLIRPTPTIQHPWR